MGDRLFSSLFLIDLFMICMIPLEQVLKFKHDPIKVTFNVIQMISSTSNFLYITDAINLIYLLLTLAIFIVFFMSFRGDSYTLSQNRGIIGFLSFLIIAFGKFIGSLFLAFQVLAIRCYFDIDVCSAYTDKTRLATNSCGIFFNLFINVLQFKYYHCMFPDKQAPWAKPESKFLIVNRIHMIIVVLILAFHDFLVDKIAYYIILIPGLFFASVIVWMCTFSVTFYAKFVDSMALLRDVIYWNLCFYGIMINLISGQQSDYSYCILIVISMVTMYLVLFLHKGQLLINSNDFQKIKNEDEAQKRIYQLLVLTDTQNSSNEFTLQQIFQNHRFNCDDSNCLCKLEDIAIESCGLVEFDDPLKDQKFNSKSNDNNEKDNFLYLGKKRNDALFQIMFMQLKKQIDNNLINFLEIFVNVSCYKRLYQSFYSLLQTKKKCNNEHDKQSYYYLRMLILQLIKESEQKYKKEIFDIDSAIDVDNKFQEYKQLLYNTTILVDRFWAQLLKKEFQIIDVIQIGNNIVDEYLKIKDLFDEIIKRKSDFKELVQLHMNFNGEVMNFEMESLQFQNMLKNIQQKLQISRQSHYYSSKEKQGLIIVSATPLKKYRIMLVNQAVCNMIEYNSAQLIGQELNFIIPSNIAEVHDLMVERFLTGNHNRYLHTQFRRLWLKMSDSSIIPARVQVQTCVSDKNGITLVAFVDPESEIQTSNFQCKYKDAYFILTNELGYLTNISKNFRRRFLKKEEFAIDDLKIHIDDFIIQLDKYTEQELKEGVKVQMIANFYNNEYKTSKISLETVDIIIIVNTYILPKKIIIKEYVFMEIKMDYNRQTFVFKSENFLNEDIQINEESHHLEDIEFIDEHQIALQINQSSESGSSRSNEVIIQKGAIDYKQIPQSLLNLRRAMLLFFFTLIATSFSVLAVTLIQNNEFQKDSLYVESAIYLGGRLACLRCAFRLLMNSPKGQSIINFYYLQEQLGVQFDLMQDDLNMISDQSSYKSSDLKSYMINENVQLSELMSDGSKTITKTTLSIAAQRFLSKIERFIHMNKTQFDQQFINFYVSRNYTAPTVDQRDAYYIITNGMYDLRSFTIEMAEKYISQAQMNKSTYDLTVLIICISCIAITLVSSMILIPVTFQLDTEQQNIVNQWMIVETNVKKDILQRVNQFLSVLQDEKKKEQKDFEKVKQKKSILREEMEFNSMRPDMASYFMSNMSQLNEQISGIMFSSPNIYRENSQLHSRKLSFFNPINEESKSPKSPEYPKSILKPSKMQQIEKVIQDTDMQTRAQFNQSAYSNANETSQYNSQFYTFHAKIVGQSESPTNARPNNTLRQSNPSLSQESNNKTLKNQTEDELSQEEIKIQQKAQLRKIYNRSKLQKIIFILLLSLTIVGFYIAFYFISLYIFETASVSYTYLRTINRRAPCLINVYNFMLETYSQNKTLYIGYDMKTPFDHAKQTCLGYEYNLQSYERDVPPALESIMSTTHKLNSKELCNIVFKGNLTYINECLNYRQGLLKDGLDQTFQTLYYHLFTEFVTFDSYRGQEYKRTFNFIEQHMFLPLTQQYLYMIYRYIIPATDYMSRLFEESLQDYLNTQIQKFLIVFIIFILFLLICLVISVRFILTYLKKIVFRSRVLVKIIPAEELSHIIKYERKQKQKQKQRKLD